MSEIFNPIASKENRRNLRSHMPKAERLLWWRIKGKNLAGLRFRRQHGIGPYIIDFYCPELNLAIELDGLSHDYIVEYDIRRQAYIESLGIKVLRYANKDVLENLDCVLAGILSAAGLSDTGDSLR